MAIRVIPDDTVLQNAAVAIQSKDHGGKMGIDEMEGRIKALPSLPIEEKDVNFYDYDGTLLYSYTLSEVQQLTELPPFPSNNDYNYQEWNRSLASIKASTQGADVAAIVTPKIADESGELGFTLYEGDPTELSLSLSLARCGATIHWGDNTTTYISSASYGGEIIVSTHQYTSSEFPYRFRIYIVYDANPYGDGGRVILIESAITGIWRQRLTTLAVSKYIVPLNSSFNNCRSLEKIYFSKNFTNSYSYNVFGGCYSLKYLFFSSGMRNIGNIQFSNCYSLSLISLSDNIFSFESSSAFQNNSINGVRLNNSITYIGNSTFRDVTTLGKIYIPNTVTHIGPLCFKECTNLYILDLSDYDDPNNIPTLDNVNAFDYTPADKVLLVRNQAMLDAFSTGTNWSAVTGTYTIKGGN